MADSNGEFELTDVPAGKYTLGYWHEILGKQTKEVEVTSGIVEVSFEYAEFQPGSN